MRLSSSSVKKKKKTNQVEKCEESIEKCTIAQLKSMTPTDAAEKFKKLKKLKRLTKPHWLHLAKKAKNPPEYYIDGQDFHTFSPLTFNRHETIPPQTLAPPRPPNAPPNAPRHRSRAAPPVMDINPENVNPGINTGALENRIRILMARENQFRNEIQQLKNANQLLETQNTTAKQSIENLNETLQTSVNENAKLSGIVAELTTRVEEFMTGDAELQNREAELQDRNEKLQESYKELQDRFAEVRELNEQQQEAASLARKEQDERINNLLKEQDDDEEADQKTISQLRHENGRLMEMNRQLQLARSENSQHAAEKVQIQEQYMAKLKDAIRQIGVVEKQEMLTREENVRLNNRLADVQRQIKVLIEAQEKFQPPVFNNNQSEQISQLLEQRHQDAAEKVRIQEQYMAKLKDAIRQIGVVEEREMLTREENVRLNNRLADFQRQIKVLMQQQQAAPAKPFPLYENRLPKTPQAPDAPAAPLIRSPLPQPSQNPETKRQSPIKQAVRPTPQSLQQGRQGLQKASDRKATEAKMDTTGLNKLIQEAMVNLRGKVKPVYDSDDEDDTNGGGVRRRNNYFRRHSNPNFRPRYPNNPIYW